MPRGHSVEQWKIKMYPAMDVYRSGKATIYFRDIPYLTLFCSYEGLLNARKRQLNNSSRCLTYPQQLSINTIHYFTRYADADQR